MVTNDAHDPCQNNLALAALEDTITQGDYMLHLVTIRRGLLTTFLYSITPSRLFAGYITSRPLLPLEVASTSPWIVPM